MKRKIEEKLTAWKTSNSRKPLVIQGARQVGKTYSVLKFGQEAFERTVHIDFSAQRNMAALFGGDITPQAVIPQIEAALDLDIDPLTTLVFFDEIQACPRALTSLKYFCERAPEYCVVAAGSLLGVALGREEYSFPVGKVDSLKLHPLDFEEFLWATKGERLPALIRSSCEKDEFFGMHQMALECYADYLMIGGMPEVVSAFANGATLRESRVLQREIVDAYLADMTKYASPLDSSKIFNVWRSVPEQLAKENHKFQYSTIASSARAHQYEAPITWLNKAGLVSYCYRVSEGRKPLDAFAEHDFFKLYLLDVGLLSAIQGLDADDIRPAIESGLSRVRGGVVENYVMQQLLSAGLKPYYWGLASKAEVDFAVQLPRVGAIPIECKSGRNVTARSLESYRGKYHPSYVIWLSTKNFGFENGIKSVPLYAAFCIG